MTGMTRGTAIEIFTNPGDLEIVIEQIDGKGPFAIGICRGPGHRYRLLLTSKPFWETKEDAVLFVGETLQSAASISRAELEDPESSIFRIFNPDGGKIDESLILNQDLIDRILEELRRNNRASTCDMFAAVG